DTPRLAVETVPRHPPRLGTGLAPPCCDGDRRPLVDLRGLHLPRMSAALRLGTASHVRDLRRLSVSILRNRCEAPQLSLPRVCGHRTYRPEAVMTARTMFRAHLAVGSLEVPVRMYAAAQDAGIHFRLLHAEDCVPVEQLMVDPHTEEPVTAATIQRGV